MKKLEQENGNEEMPKGLDRRSFLQSAALTSLAVATPRDWASSITKSAGEAFPAIGGLTKFVDVFIGTGGHGHTYPGATVPFGMGQLSPDTWNGDWDHCSGYRFDDTSMIGFSHTHLSGTGVGDLLDALVMPEVGPVHTQPGPRDHRRLDTDRVFLMQTSTPSPVTTRCC